MAELDTGENLRFEVGASVVLKLGRDLITSSYQAVIELVKNSYDADASWASVEIDSTAVADAPELNGATGYIKITDSGHGMTLEDIRRGWLTIAMSHKQRMKQEGRKTPGKNRTPLGDKGLGRLGSQALGRYVHIETRPSSSGETLSVWIDWQDFLGDRVLSDVVVRCSRTARAPTQRSGTAITIWGLTDPEAWRGRDAHFEIQRRMVSLISPFASIGGFTIGVTLDGQVLDLVEFSQGIRRAAATSFSFEFDGHDVLVMKGRAKLAYCRPAPPDKSHRQVAQQQFAAYVASDGGGRLFQRLAERTSGKARAMKLSRLEGTEWFVGAESTRSLGGLSNQPLVDKKPLSPGPFRGELDTFVLAGESDLRVDPAQKAIIKDGLAGIRVYRDGFGVTVADDWLGLGSMATRGGSYFELKVDNTVGYIAITSEHNRQLEETSDRQRFKQETPAFRAFRQLMLEVIKFVGEFQEMIRRGTSDFLEDEATRSKGVDPQTSAQQADARFQAFVEDALAAKPRLEEQRRSIHEVRERLAPHLSPPGSSQPALVGQLTFAHAAPDPKVAQLQHEADQALESVHEFLGTINSVLSEADAVSALKNLLGSRMELLDRSTMLLHEAASLGLSAEIMAHEIAQISDGLLNRAKAMLSSARAGAVASTEVIRFSEHVRSQANALQRQANHIAPALRYVREQKSELNVFEVVEELVGYHAPRLSDREGITLRCTRAGASKFSVKMNQGKLTQVLDNLIINAQFWVTEALRRGQTAEGIIDIEVERPFIRVSDSGPGVDPGVEGLLFENPFITTKTDGRGLGLFLSGRLLESDGCKLTLAPDRNEHGRRFKFLIDLSGVLHDAG